MTIPQAHIACRCEGRYFQTEFHYDRPPAGEVRFPATSERYARRFERCGLCDHFRGAHDLDLSALYAGDYVTSTYGPDGMRRAFDCVLALAPGRSDNVGRVARVLTFASCHWAAAPRPAPTVLDVGSGLCVFLAAMKHHGWKGTAFDSDERTVAHARDVVGVEAVRGDFMTGRSVGRFDVVTFNKVLEHVPEPAAMLARAHDTLSGGGFVYLEVPDGEAAARSGPDREEFFVDHWHAFSPASLAILAREARFSTLAIERLREPSGKFTLRAFLEEP